MIKILMSGVLLSGVLFAQDIYATFTVNASKKADLVLSSTGLIKKIYVDVGDRVKRGDLLLELASDDLKTSLTLAKKKIELAAIHEKYAKKAYERFLKVKDVIDEGKFDSYSASYESAKVELAKAKANLAYKKALLAKTKLRAPFNGVISQKFVQEGDGVSAARMGTLFRLISQKKQKLIITIDEKYWDKVKVGQSFSFGVDGSDAKYSSKISKIYPSVDAKKRALTLEVKTSGLKVGLFGHGYLKVD